MTLSEVPESICEYMAGGGHMFTFISFFSVSSYHEVKF